MSKSTKNGDLPERWAASAKAIRAVQVAFDVEEQVLQTVRKAAFINQLSNSDQIRLILGLPVTRCNKRPRLTISLSETDYILLSERYGVDAGLKLEIKERALRELQHFSQQNQNLSKE